MRRLLLATVAVVALAAPTKADIIDVGQNPTSATGHFSNDVGGGAFDDFITFQLVGGPQFLAFASATNDFLSSSDFITGFTGQLFQQVGVPGGGDDIPFNAAVLGVPCPTDPSGCQILAGSATLNPGNFYLELTGVGGGNAGYGGDITTRAVPGPIVGVPEPGTWAMMMLGFAGIWYGRKKGWLNENLFGTTKTA